MIKILTVIPLAWDGTSFYRANGVFRDLTEKIDVEFTPYHPQPGGWSWAEFSKFDIVFLQRPGKPEHLKLAQYCKEVGLKVWLDYDDNFFVLPPENRMSEAISPEVRKSMGQLIRLADAITVSTQALHDYMKGVGARYVEVVPNALNTGLVEPVKHFNIKRPSVPPTNQKQVYVWRGSDTHHVDVADYMPEMIEVIEKRKDVNWHFFGFNPILLTRLIPHVGSTWTFVGPEDIIIYYKKLRGVRPELMHVVLSPNEFNLNKSNIAWLEATTAGAVCVAPDWPEWNRPGVVNYKAKGQFMEMCTSYVETMTNVNDLPLGEYWEASMTYIQENLLLSKVNKQRADMIQKLRDGYKFEVQLPIPNSMIE